MSIMISINEDGKAVAMLETGHVQDIDDSNIDELVLYLRPYFSQYNYRLEYDFYNDKDDFMKYAKYEE